MVVCAVAASVDRRRDGVRLLLDYHHVRAGLLLRRLGYSGRLVGRRSASVALLGRIVGLLGRVALRWVAGLLGRVAGLRGWLALLGRWVGSGLVVDWIGSSVWIRHLFCAEKCRVFNMRMRRVGAQL